MFVVSVTLSLTKDIPIIELMARRSCFCEISSMSIDKFVLYMALGSIAVIGLVFVFALDEDVAAVLMIVFGLFTLFLMDLTMSDGTRRVCSRLTSIGR